MSDLEPFLSQVARRTDVALDRALPPIDSLPQRLHEAMRYSVFAGGKRLRPALVHAASELGRAVPEAVDDAAAALELVHTYSLIHDDLPAMDDDALRRGKPTCHVAFGEAHAILAGDALLTLAFAVLANSSGLSANQKADAVSLLARSAGAGGMVGGQTADIQAERAEVAVDADLLEFIHLRKTGALIGAAVALGGLAAGLEQATVQRLEVIGQQIGLAFQIADDLLDVEAPASVLGKTAGKDAQAGKLTYPALYGLHGAKARASDTAASADRLLAELGEGAARLRRLTRYVIERKH